jgi:beta-lactam-binding protein with PASTA domain
MVKRRLVAIAASAFVIGSGCVTDARNESPHYRVEPNVAGMRMKRAKRVLKEHGYEVVARGGGIVMRQSPAPPAPKGTTIFLKGTSK